ncbi:hypothetical protein [Azonexus hydrophilus]|uniref:hypothetical protein n=1 Tax=Azonexus hydrophilus TaxID=418702 RepID=UPI0012FABB84|nr:hypothetical protein [Azonexus hydrophilus]
MDKQRIAKKINKAINGHLERVYLSQGNLRYWPQEFITPEMLADEELFQDFQIIADMLINTEEQEEQTNGDRHKETDVGSVSKQSRRSKGSRTSE